MLITDDRYHYLNDDCGDSSVLTKEGMVSELADAECKVYISLYPRSMSPPLDDWYRDLLVNGGEFDPWVDNEGWLFTKLRASIPGLP